MKILCISDIVDPLIYSSNIKTRYADVDLVISAGDLPMEYLEFIVSSLNKPLLFVFGNHNLNELVFYHPKLAEDARTPLKQKMPIGFGSTYVGFKVHKEGKVLFAGLSGSIKYNNGLCQYSNAQMQRKLIGLIPKLIYNKLRYGRYLDILITHAPPRGIHDKDDPCHRGFDCFLWFMKKFKPRYLLHGHVHLYDLQAKRVSTYHETTVINVYSQYLLEMREYNG